MQDQVDDEVMMVDCVLGILAPGLQPFLMLGMLADMSTDSLSGDASADNCYK